jgi:hypothetical protein
MGDNCWAGEFEGGAGAAGIGGGRGGNSGTVRINYPSETSSDITEAKVSRIWIQPGPGIDPGGWGHSSGTCNDGSPSGAYVYDADGWPKGAVYSWGN